VVLGVHLNCQLLFNKYAKTLFKSDFRVLEIGPDKLPSSFCEEVDDRSIEWETLEYVSSEKFFTSDDLTERLTYTTRDPYRFPIPDNTFDVIVSANVIEHVRKIWEWIPELARICKPGGCIVTINPVSWPYHEAPVDCWRIYPEGMKALYESAGIEIKTSAFESLAPPTYSAYHLLKQGLKRAIGIRPWLVQPDVIDTIAIGIKR
jgi:SAM-dependent methyltransferase